MLKINVETREGSALLLSAESGQTLMSVLREANLVEAVCGGQCSCATCHVYIAPEYMERVGPAEGVEMDLLECGLEMKATSRLSCQITLTEDLDGLTVVVAPAEG